MAIAFPPGPRGDGPLVVPLTLDVRIRTEYDVRFMQDRIVAELFIGDEYAGAKAVAVPPETQMYDQYGRSYMIRQYAPDLTRMAVRGFIGQHQDRRTEITALEGEIAGLRRHLDRMTRIRWWQLRARLAYRKAVREAADAEA